MTAQLADRVMKARRESMCIICQQPIRIGQLIARTGAWVHAQCAIDRYREDNMPTIGGQLDAATIAQLARHTTSTPDNGKFNVSRVGNRVVAVRDPGGLVLDLDPATARQLGRDLLDAGRTEGQA